MSIISAVKSLNIKGIELCECKYYRTQGTCWHIDPSVKKSVKGESGKVNGNKTLDKFIQSPKSEPPSSPKFGNQDYRIRDSLTSNAETRTPRDKALLFQKYLRSQGIQSELREESNTFAVFYQKAGWKGYTYSYVKIFS